MSDDTKTIENAIVGTGDQDTPDSLMSHFKGKGLVSIAIFTVVVHVVVIGGSSIPFLVDSVFSPDNAAQSRDERVRNAVEDATAALNKIAEKHNLSPQDISSQFGGAGSRAAKVASQPGDDVESPSPLPQTDSDAEGDTSRERSDYEKALESSKAGPSVPALEDEEDDIF